MGGNDKKSCNKPSSNLWYGQDELQLDANLHQDMKAWIRRELGKRENVTLKNLLVQRVAWRAVPARRYVHRGNRSLGIQKN